MENADSHSLVSSVKRQESQFVAEAKAARWRAVIGCLNPSRIAHMHLMLISLASAPPEGSDRSGLVVKDGRDAFGPRNPQAHHWKRLPCKKFLDSCRVPSAQCSLSPAATKAAYH